MPGGDRTGPRGEGPMTGRAAGYCGANATAGFANRNPGRRFFGRVGTDAFFGRGRGWRNQYWATGLPGWVRYPGVAQDFNPYGATAETGMSPEEEGEVLKEQATYLEQQLKNIKNRISELGKTANKTKK